MYTLKGLSKDFLIIEDSGGEFCKDITIPLGHNKEWLNPEKIGTRVKMSLVLDKHGYYVLYSIFKKSVRLTLCNMYKSDLYIEVQETPSVEWLGYRVGIKIEESTDAH